MSVKKIKRNRRILANDGEFTDDGGRSKPLPYVKFYGLLQTAPAFNFAFASARYFASLNMTNCDEEEQSVMSRIFAELKSRLGKANTRNRTCRTVSGV